MFTRAPPFASLMSSNFFSSTFEWDLLLCLHRAGICDAALLSEHENICIG